MSAGNPPPDAAERGAPQATPAPGDPDTQGEPRRRRPRRGESRRAGHAPTEHKRGTGPRRGPKPPSAELIEARRAAVPAITYPPQLPVSARKDDIAEAIAGHQVVVIAGETGSGKTTQIPKICLELGRGIAGTIGHTQPRRIAARSVADRIAEELGVELGGAVGFQVRFTDKVSATSLIKVMTDGILLAEIQRDPQLLRYDTIIVDEAHERSLNIDFILGYLRRLLPRRPDLKVIVTSATIDSDRFARHFALNASGLVVPTIDDDGEPAPVIEVTGRTYPVELRYRPLVADRDGGRGDEARGGDEQGEASGAVVDGLVLDANGDLIDETAPEEDLDQPTAIARAVDELIALGPGDILVFCSGEREIRDAADALRDWFGTRFTGPGATNTTPGAVEVLPLYARLSAAEQHRIFEPHRYRRVVISTNVAETSLTVPGIRYVVDTGYARISRYSNRTKVQRLPIEPISQASANQRSGRCGRVADGVAIRLYSSADYAGRPEFTEPEILRTSLASVILQMAALGLGRMEEFPFVEPPELRAVRDGVALLTELGAIRDPATPPSSRPPVRERKFVLSRGDVGDTPGAERHQEPLEKGRTSSRDGGGSGADDGGVRLTEVGRRLAQLPIDPRLGRMLIEADRLGVVNEVMVIVSALSVQDVRERPADQTEQADSSHRRFATLGSDFLSLITLWDYVADQRDVMGSSAFRRMCRAEFLHFLRIREWQDVHGQLRQLAASIGIKATHRDKDHRLEGVAERGTIRHRRIDADEVHQALLAGLLSHIGSWDERRREFQGARGSRFVPFPGSTLARKPPAFVMAAELVETSRLFARTCARITPEWAEKLGGDLVKRNHSEPYWSSKKGAAMCHERVMLYGVTLVADRIVPFAKVDPELAREMFIRHALVEGRWMSHHRFVAKNADLRADAADLAERTRRLELLADEEALVDFFDERLPASITTARTFDAWWKNERRERPHLLTYTLDLLAPGAAEVDTSGLPQTWHQLTPDGADLALPLTYQFSPGLDADGITVHVPLAILPRLRPAGFDWLVPALLPELATATIRALPKPVRVQLVPAPDTAAAALDHLPDWADVAPAGPDAPTFADAFASALRQVRGAVVPPEAFEDVPDRLPAHLRVTFRVTGERGQVLGESHDLPYLQRRLAAQSQAAVTSAVRAAVKAAQKPARPGPNKPADDGGAPPGGHLTTAGAVEVERVRSWDSLPDGPIPAEIATVVGGLEVKGYPALVVEGVGAERHVALRVLASEATARAEHPRGVRELLLAETALAEGRVTSRWRGNEALTLASSPYRNTSELVRDLQAAAIARLTEGVDLAQVRTEQAYRSVRADVRNQLEDAVYRVAAQVVEVLTAHRELQGQIKAATSMALLATLQQLREHDASLIYPGFVAATPPERLRDLTRYLKADSQRLAKAAQNPARDQTLAWEVTQLADAIEAVDSPALSPDRRSAVAGIRWLVEELRVSLFAQQLGTSEPVSAKRIRKALADV